MFYFQLLAEVIKSLAHLPFKIWWKFGPIAIAQYSHRFTVFTCTHDAAMHASLQFMRCILEGAIHDYNPNSTGIPILVACWYHATLFSLLLDVVNPIVTPNTLKYRYGYNPSSHSLVRLYVFDYNDHSHTILDELWLSIMILFILRDNSYICGQAAEWRTSHFHGCRNGGWNPLGGQVDIMGIYNGTIMGVWLMGDNEITILYIYISIYIYIYIYMNSIFICRKNQPILFLFFLWKWRMGRKQMATFIGQMMDKAKWFQRIAKGLPGLWSNTYQTCVSQRHLLLLSRSFRHVFRYYFESPGTEQETMKHQPSKTIEDICCRLLQQLNQPQNIKLKKNDRNPTICRWFSGMEN